MRRVIIESPWAGDINRNAIYLQRAMRHSLLNGEAPFASHKLYVLALDDNLPEERALGIEAGYSWWESAKGIIFYLDYGWSPGMNKAQAHFWKVTKLYSLTYEERLIGPNP